MSTNNQNVTRKPPRATNIKVSEKSKIKTDDNKKPTGKKDQPEKIAMQSKLEKEKILKSQAKSNLNMSKTKLASKYLSSPSSSSRSSKTSSTESTKLKAEVKKSNTSQPTVITNKLQTKNKTTTKEQSIPASNRVSSTKFFPSKQIFTEAIKNSLSEEAAKKQERNDKSKNKTSDESTSNEANKIKDFPASNKTKNTEKSNLQAGNTTKNRERNKARVLSPSEASKIKDESDEIKNKEKSNLQAEDTTKNRERNKTRVLSPSEVKVLKQEASLDSNYDERPRTATIKKSEPTQETNDNSYEDDFDSYESDFEAYSSSDVSSAAHDVSSDESSANSESIKSVDSPRQSKFTESEEDRKLDSGTYDLPENKHKQVLDNIKEFVEPAVLEQNRSNLASLSDEGFEEGKSLERAVSQFVNFVDAQKKHNHLRSLQKKQKRGEEILSMIRLDNQSSFLFEIPAIPYEVFIQKYGNNNAIQVAVQTGDDVLAEESQTDRIDYSNKWTQFPVAFSNYDQSDSRFMIKYKMECLGVGVDSTNEAAQHVMQEYNKIKLNEFLSVVGDVVMTLLEEKNQKISKDIEANSGIVPFSDGYIQFNTNIQMLQEHKVIFISFSTCGAKFLSIHTNHNSEADLKTIICVWKISNPNEPELVLTAYGQVTCCCFDDNINLIYGGLSNGTIAVWDLSEKRNLSEENMKNSFMTNISSGHTSMIVSIVSAVDEEDLLNRNRIRQNCNSQQIYTLDDDGNLMIWSVIILQQSHRKAISLVLNSKLSFSEEYPQLTNLRCTHMSVNLLDTNHIFVSTNYGIILHFITSGAKPIPKKYGALQSQVNCISPCPFSPFYFLSGSQNGSVMLYSRNMEKPLMTMSNGEDYRDSEIEFIEWSYSRPCIFYTKDSKNNLHVWDLTISDIFPTYTIPFKEKVNFIKLSPVIPKDNSNTKSYLIIVTNDCTIKLHILNKEHRQQTQIEYEENVKKFLNYVNRL